MGYTSDARLAAYIATIIEVNNGIAALNATGQIYSYRAPMACGVIAITPVANVATSGAVTFPASRFRTAANIVVTVTPVTATPNAFTATVQSVTATGCNVWVLRGTTTVATVYWIAMEETWLGS